MKEIKHLLISIILLVSLSAYADSAPADDKYLTNAIEVARSALNTLLSSNTSTLTTIASQLSTNSTNLSTLNTTLSSLQTQANNIPVTRSIGDSLYGGKVFWVDSTGYHGLVAALSDISGTYSWRNTSYNTSHAEMFNIGSGANNTLIIVGTENNDDTFGTYAAKLCSTYTTTDGTYTYAGWHLPSREELLLLYAQQAIFNNFASDRYWTSSECSSSTASTVLFTNGATVCNTKWVTYYVRCIHSF